MSGKPILCVDFDGVIHSYTSGWVDAVTIPDPPVPGALDWLRTAVNHFDVQIYSSRSKTAEGRIAMAQWCDKHGLNVMRLQIKFPKAKPPAFLTIDDRAICFKGDFTAIPPSALLSFKPWNKL